MHDDFMDFTPKEKNLLRSLNTPRKTADFVEALAYNLEEDTDFSPKLVLEKRVANCFEAAVFAACALRFHGHEPLLLDLRCPVDEDHVLCVFKRHGRWGSVAKSKFSGLRSRDAVYKSLRELVMSYFEHFYTLEGKKDLREYSRPLNLKRFDRLHWMASPKPVSFIAEALDEQSHYRLIERVHGRHLRRVTGHLYDAGLVGHPQARSARQESVLRSGK